MNEETKSLIGALEEIRADLHAIAVNLEVLNMKLDSFTCRTQYGNFLCVTGNISNND